MRTNLQGDTMPFILENIVVPAVVGFTVGALHRVIKNRSIHIFQ